MVATVKEAWGAAEQRRSSLTRRCEHYAAFTLPTICLPDGYDQQSEELQTDFQSVGALAVNSLANKLILALFAPSRPFMRYDIPPELEAKIKEQVPDLQQQLAVAEKNSTKLLDQLSSRPRLYEVARNLIVTGNCLLIL